VATLPCYTCLTPCERLSTNVLDIVITSPNHCIYEAIYHGSVLVCSSLLFSHISNRVYTNFVYFNGNPTRKIFRFKFPHLESKNTEVADEQKAVGNSKKE
jgi:hypothetical protein